MRDPAKVDRVIEACEAWGRATFPTWNEDMEFMIWTPAPEGYGIWRPVGSERPDVESPFVGSLYLAGDQFGRRLWGGGVDEASRSAVMCVERELDHEQRHDHAQLDPDVVPGRGVFFHLGTQDDHRDARRRPGRIVAATEWARASDPATPPSRYLGRTRRV